MAEHQIKKDWISKEHGVYVIYFLHYDEKIWNIIAHLHLGENNDTVYHCSSKKRKQAFAVAKKHVSLKCELANVINLIHPVNISLKKSRKYESPVLTSEQLGYALNNELPTSREDDTPDDGVNGDSLPNPRVTKKQLDKELNDYWSKNPRN
jgi:hypothetical protein